MIHVSTIPAVPAAEAKADDVANDRTASRRAPFVARSAVLRRRRLDMRRTAELSQTRLTQQQAHRPTLGALSQERALGPTNDLDTIDIEEQRTNFTKIALQTMQRGIVDEDAGRRSPTGVVHSTNRQVGRDPGADRRVEVVFHARGRSGKLVEALGARPVHGIG